MGGSVRPKNLKKCMKLNKLEFLEGWGGGGLGKNPFGGGGMDIFWNYTLKKNSIFFYALGRAVASWLVRSTPELAVCV